jgi:hypothetical protein
MSFLGPVLVALPRHNTSAILTDPINDQVRLIVIYNTSEDISGNVPLDSHLQSTCGLY